MKTWANRPHEPQWEQEAYRDKDGGRRYGPIHCKLCGLRREEASAMHLEQAELPIP